MFSCTINDFPSYGNLSGYNVKGHHACPICEEDTSYIQQKHGRKIVYTRHRHFLKPYHPYWQLKKTFNGSQEYKSVLYTIMLRKHNSLFDNIFQMLQNIFNNIFTKF